MPSGNKPLPEPMLTQIFATIWHTKPQWVNISVISPHRTCYRIAIKDVTWFLMSLTYLITLCYLSFCRWVYSTSTWTRNWNRKWVRIEFKNEYGLVLINVTIFQELNVYQLSGWAETPKQYTTWVIVRRIIPESLLSIDTMIYIYICIYD